MVLYHSSDLNDHKLIRLQNLFNAGAEAASNNFAFKYMLAARILHVLSEYHYDFDSRAPELIIPCGILAAPNRCVL